MSDKMLMEDWRKFLVEKKPFVINRKPLTDEEKAKLEKAKLAARVAHKAQSKDSSDFPEEEEHWSQEKKGTLTQGECYNIGELLFNLSNIQAEYETPEQKKAAMKAFFGSLIGAGEDAALIAILSSAIAGGGALEESTKKNQLLTEAEPLTMAIVSAGFLALVRMGTKFWKLKRAQQTYGPGLPVKHEFEQIPKKLTSFKILKMMKVSDQYLKHLNPGELEQIDEKYEEYLANEFASLLDLNHDGFYNDADKDISEVPDLTVCFTYGANEQPADILTINQWIAHEYLPDDSPLKRSGRPDTRPMFKPTGKNPEDIEAPDLNESKSFHDNWRNFLLTEEKK